MECIYCKGSGPFNKEHVFPKGMGGDDLDFLLINVVCESCNSKFSKLEASFMRSSPLALSRLINQTASRGNHKSPQFNTTTNFVHDPESNSLLEATYETGLKAILLPQLIFKESHLSFHATNAKELIKFIDKLKSLLEPSTVEVARKKLGPKPNQFIIETYTWTDKSYINTSSRLQSTQPKNVIWLEIYEEKQTQPERTPFETRIYHRKQGEIALKSITETNTSKNLKDARLYMHDGLKIETATIRDIEKPLTHVEFTSNISEGDRAFAKIGINFLAHIMGEDYVRDPSFDSIKKSILTGTPTLPITMLVKNTSRASDEMLGEAIDGHHTLMLCPAPLENGKTAISFVAKLYGTHFGIRLSSGVNSNKLKEPIFLEVDYNNHKIKSYNLLKYIEQSDAHKKTRAHYFAQKYPIKLSDDFFLN